MKEEVGSSLARSQSDYLWFLLAAFEQTRNANAAGRNLAGLETGTVSAKTFANKHYIMADHLKPRGSTQSFMLEENSSRGTWLIEDRTMLTSGIAGYRHSVTRLR